MNTNSSPIQSNTDVVIKVENLWKQYRYGTIGHGTLYKDFQTWWAKILGKDDPNSPIYQSQSSKSNNDDSDYFWALKDISFEVKRGEIIGIIGRNGAGKSTLLKIISRVTTPTKGQIKIRGRVASLLEVGTGFHPELTGRENIYLNGTILGMTKSEINKKFDEIVAFAEIEKFIDTPVKRYSSGMYVRLAFAVAAHLDPEILVVDEVLAVGDAQFQKKCLGKMEMVSKEGRTVLFVSHNMAAITRLCSRAILLEKSQLIENSDAVNVVATYLNKVFETCASCSWTEERASGMDKLRLVSVSLTKDDGTSTAIVSVEDQLKIKIGYYISVPKLNFRCVAIFFTQGVCAFASVEPVEIERSEKGLYYSTVIIPPHLLAEGEYVVTISIFSSKGVKSHYVVERDVIAFQVNDPINGNSARGDYMERLTGVVMPRLKWQLNFIPNS